MSLNIWYDFKWMVLHSIFFCVYLKSKMAATTVQCFSSWSNEEKKKKKICSKQNFIEPNLNVNKHWMVPYKIVIFSCGLEIQDVHNHMTYLILNNS
jgi:hypothetical protein